ncbi:MAG TPA: hypothetical protein VFU02_22600 [Polyangiaceae bacterium]|nr:hypothetical protein [Polyangiaceae bacterium]
MKWALKSALVLATLTIAGWGQAAGRVVVLKPTSGAPSEWPEATRSALAELALAGFEVVVEPSHEIRLELLLQQLKQATQDENTVAGVLITRVQAGGVGYVWIKDAPRAQRLTEEHPDSALAHNAFALRLVDVLRERRLTLPAPEEAIPAEPPEPAPSPGNSHVRLGLHAAAGATWVPADAVAPLIQFGGHMELTNGLSLSLSGHSLLAPFALDTEAGGVSILSRGVSLALLFDPRAGSPWGIRAGAAAGTAWFRADGRDSASHEARSDGTTVGTLSLLVAGRFRSDRLSVTLSGEPQWLLPKLRVTATDGREVESIPFAFSLMLGLGWQA